MNHGKHHNLPLEDGYFGICSIFGQIHIGSVAEAWENAYDPLKAKNFYPGRCCDLLLVFFHIPFHSCHIQLRNFYLVFFLFNDHFSCLVSLGNLSLALVKVEQGRAQGFRPHGCQTYLVRKLITETKGSNWLVVEPTPLKNITQLGWFFPIYGKRKNVPNHQLV